MKHCGCNFKRTIKRLLGSLPVIITRSKLSDLRGSTIVQQRHCKMYQAEIKELEEEIAQLKEKNETFKN